MNHAAFSQIVGCFLFVFLDGDAFCEGIDLKLEIPAAGVYEIPAAEVRAAGGVPPEPIRFDSLELKWNAKSLFLWPRDENGNGQLDPEDKIVFLAPPESMDLVSGESYPTVFRLKTISSAGSSSLGIEMEITTLEQDSSGVPPLLLRAALEQDSIRSGFVGSDSREADHHYWLSTSSLDEESIPVFRFSDLPFHELADPDRVSATFALRGPTRIANSKFDIPDHSIEISIDGTAVGKREWYGTFEQLWTVGDLAFPMADRELTLQSGKRRTPDDDFIADIVYLNHVTVTSPLRQPIPGNFSGQIPVTTEGSGDFPPARRLSLKESSAALYLETGKSWMFPPGDNSYLIELDPDAGPVHGFLIVPGEERLPESITAWPTADLSELVDGTTDSLIIVPEDFADDLEPLVAQHRERGFRPLVVTVEDICHEYGSGLPSRESIRSAIGAWYVARRDEEFRYVLLIGDASPDLIGEGRNRIPTYELQIRGVLCASDNPYACVAGDDEMPDVAIGRIPVASKEELKAIIRKMVSREPDPDTMPGQTQSLWVVDHEGYNRENAETLISRLEQGGVQSRTVFVEEGETNEGRMARFETELKKGPDVLFYCGHGARYYWRTGPVDYEKQSSLFSSDDLTDLTTAQPHPPTRVVFTLTCDSAPFDHPTEDTLGEHFVTVTGGGSLTFIGPSWKVRNDFETVRAFSEAFLASETVGQAFLGAKIRAASRMFTDAYNLLGDPTTPLR